ncbi:MAG: rhodanese-like domain-containing protein [Acidimicrobiales bacterium]
MALIDVRTPEEFAEGHLDAPRLIDYNAPGFAEQVAELDRSVPYFVYCRSGNRSAGAVAVMAGLGFETVYELDGASSRGRPPATPSCVGFAGGFARPSLVFVAVAQPSIRSRTRGGSSSALGGVALISKACAGRLSAAGTRAGHRRGARAGAVTGLPVARLQPGTAPGDGRDRVLLAGAPGPQPPGRHPHRPGVEAAQAAAAGSREHYVRRPPAAAPARITALGGHHRHQRSIAAPPSEHVGGVRRRGRGRPAAAWCRPARRDRHPGQPARPQRALDGLGT